MDNGHLAAYTGMGAVARHRCCLGLLSMVAHIAPSRQLCHCDGRDHRVDFGPDVSFIAGAVTDVSIRDETRIAVAATCFGDGRSHPQ